MSKCPDDPVSAVLAVLMLFVGLPAGLALIWASIRFVNHRWPARQ